MHDDCKLYEMLVLGGAQAGLSWATILKRRAEYRKAFAAWDLDAVARFDDADVERLLAPDSPANIIRNRSKVKSAVKNARAAVTVRAEFGSLDKFFWSFVGFKPILNTREAHEPMPAVSPASERMSKDMKKRGFTFCGPTIMYAFMQTCGMVNDHQRQCFCYGADA